MTTGPDVSNWQGAVDWSAVRGAGHEFAILKATEGTGYADPGVDVNRARAHASGMAAVGLYHFARGGDPVAEANFFSAHVGPLAADEFPVLDWEISPPGTDPVAWCAAYCDTVRARLGKLPVIYLNGPRVARSDWSPLVAMGVRLWLAGDGVNAAYDNDPKLVTVQWWGQPALKQYSETGRVPGIDGAVDLNVFYGTKTDLTAFAAGNTPEPPQSEEDDMFSAFRSGPQYGGNGNIFLGAPGRWVPVFSMRLLDWYAHLGILRKGVDGLFTDVSPAQFDHLAAVYAAASVPQPPADVV